MQQNGHLASVQSAILTNIITIIIRSPISASAKHRPYSRVNPRVLAAASSRCYSQWQQCRRPMSLPDDPQFFSLSADTTRSLPYSSLYLQLVIN